MQVTAISVCVAIYVCQDCRMLCHNSADRQSKDVASMILTIDGFLNCLKRKWRDCRLFSQHLTPWIPLIEYLWQQTTICAT